MTIWKKRERSLLEKHFDARTSFYASMI